MRKHGWELPYHPLQVVAVAVFLALGFAFYVFFSPFVGSKLFQYIIMGIYTPLIITAFGLYIWSAATDPADPGVFKSKKYLKTISNNKHTHVKESKLCVESTSSIQEPNAEVKGEKNITEMRKEANLFTRLKVLLPCFIVCNCSNSEETIEQHMSEEGMFYCSLCEVEVHKNSKHCRVCDKCVDSFDHHCRWLNNCVGKRNYRKFFTLMVSSLLLLILQWSTGILVLIMCFLERKRFSIDITKNLGSSFTLVPFLIVVGVCTILAMIATLPLVQLFFFHILLIKKGISTYDYIIALREQDQVGTEAQQSPQMSPISSIGVSSVSSFNTFQRAAWCTPPRLFVEDQFDVVPPETGSVSSLGKKSPTKKKAPVKISPWTLARLNTEEVTKAAAQARKKSKILQPVTRRHALNNRNNSINNGGSSSFASLQLEARSVFNTSRAIVASSPESSSLDSPDLHPFRVSVEGRQIVGFSRSTSDGYDASGGEDSDRVSTRIMQRSINWSNLLFGSGHNEIVNKLNVPSSSSHT